jgi:large subunit ribosomal protein L35
VLSKSLPLKPLLSPKEEGLQKEVTRSVVKFGRLKGRRKTVKAVLKRFYRLDWGIWIHPKAGRHRHLWQKGKLQKKRARQHVFCNAWHTRTLERMTTKYWHKKKYWVDDIYEPYHSRPDFWITKNTKNIVHQLD